jgi:hypothetical protein
MLNVFFLKRKKECDKMRFTICLLFVLGFAGAATAQDFDWGDYSYDPDVNAQAMTFDGETVDDSDTDTGTSELNGAVETASAVAGSKAGDAYADAYSQATCNIRFETFERDYYECTAVVDFQDEVEAFTSGFKAWTRVHGSAVTTVDLEPLKTGKADGLLEINTLTDTGSPAEHPRVHIKAEAGNSWLVAEWVESTNKWTVSWHLEKGDDPDDDESGIQYTGYGSLPTNISKSYEEAVTDGGSLILDAAVNEGLSKYLSNYMEDESLGSNNTVKRKWEARSIVYADIN